MRDEKLRSAIDGMANDLEIDNLIIFDNHAYDRSIIGIADDRLVYDYDKMVEEYMEDEGCDEADAEEWIQYNTIRSIPYIKGNKPLIITMSRDQIIESYGDDDCDAKGENDENRK